MKGKTEKYRLINITQDSSRREANNLMRQLYPNFDWHLHCVHHKDENPFNNDINNLLIIKRAEHTKLHNGGKIRPRPKKTKKTKKEKQQTVIKTIVTKTIIKTGNQTDVFVVGSNWRRWWIIIKVKYSKKTDLTEIKLKHI